jgi:hypothetical protein
MVGKLKSCVLQCDERKFETILENIEFLSDLWINLFSVYKALINGIMIGNEGLFIKLTKGETTPVFDQRLNTNGAFVPDIKMVPVLIK